MSMKKKLNFRKVFPEVMENRSFWRIPGEANPGQLLLKQTLLNSSTYQPKVNDVKFLVVL